MKQLITEQMFDVTRDKRCRSYAIAFWISSGNSITSAPAGPSHPFPPLPPPRVPGGSPPAVSSPVTPAPYLTLTHSLTQARFLSRAWRRNGAKHEKTKAKPETNILKFSCLQNQCTANLFCPPPSQWNPCRFLPKLLPILGKVI